MVSNFQDIITMFKNKFSIIFYYFLPVAFLFGFLRVYHSAITARYAMHNDYSLLLSNKGPLNFFESMHLIWVGRPIGALLVNIPFCNIHSFHDFIVWRWIDFWSMMITLTVFIMYLSRRWRVPLIWALLCAATAGFLPSSILYVIWITNWAPGFLNILIALVAYIIFDLRRWAGEDKSRFFHFSTTCFGFLLFQIALCIYPPSALVVLFFTYLHIFLADWNTIDRVRRFVIQDFIFVIFSLAIYRYIERAVIHPLAVSLTPHYIPSSPDYQMGVGFDLQKIRLLLDTVNVSFSGTWYLIFFEAGILVWLGLMAFFFIVNYQKLTKEWRLNLEKGIWLVLIILLMNAPALLAEGVHELIGFRVLFPTAILGSGLLVLGFMVTGREAKYRLLSLVLAFTMVIFSGIVVTEHLKKVVNNYARELNLMRQGLKNCNVEKTRYYFFVRLPKGENLSGYRLPFEYSLMITGPQHFIPFVREYLLSKHAKQHVEAEIISEQQASEYGIRSDACYVRVR